MESVVNLVWRSNPFFRCLVFLIVIFGSQCRGLEPRGVADEGLAQPAGIQAQDSPEPGPASAESPAAVVHRIEPTASSPSSTTASAGTEATVAMATPVGPRDGLATFRSSRILQGHWRSTSPVPPTESPSTATTSPVDQEAEQGMVLVTLVPFRDYGETLVYKGYVRQFLPGSAKPVGGGQLLNHFYVPMITVSAGGNSLQFSSFSSSPWQLSKLDWKDDGTELGFWQGDMVDAKGGVMGEVRLTPSQSENPSPAEFAGVESANCFASSGDPGGTGTAPEGLRLERIRVGDPETTSLAWPQLNLVQSQSECRDTTQCDLEAPRVSLLPSPVYGQDTGHDGSLDTKTVLAKGASPANPCLATPDVRLPPEEGFPSALVEWDQGGVYYGHLYHEALDRYQWVRLRTIGSEIEKRRYVSGTMTMFFGDMEDNLFIVQRFTPQRVFNGGQAFAFDGEKSEAYLLVKDLRADQIEASYYSKNYGYIGPIKLWRQGMIKPPEPFRVVARPIAAEIRSDCKLNLEMESSSVSGYYNLYESIATRGALNCPSTGNLRVNGLWYDYYKGIAVLRQGPAPIGIYHHATHTLLLP